MSLFLRVQPKGEKSLQDSIELSADRALIVLAHHRPFSTQTHMFNTHGGEKQDPTFSLLVAVALLRYASAHGSGPVSRMATKMLKAGGTAKLS